MKCLKCETVSSDDALYCRNCGIRLVPLIPNAPADERIKTVPMVTKVMEFQSSGAYKRWLRLHGDVEILSASATKPWGLLAGPFTRKQQITLTYRISAKKAAEETRIQVIATLVAIAILAIIVIAVAIGSQF